MRMGIGISKAGSYSDALWQRELAMIHVKERQAIDRLINSFARYEQEFKRGHRLAPSDTVQKLECQEAVKIFYSCLVYLNCCESLDGVLNLANSLRTDADDAVKAMATAAPGTYIYIQNAAVFSICMFAAMKLQVAFDIAVKSIKP